MILVDTHCHLDFNTFDTDRANVLQRAVDRGLERILVPGIDLESSQRAIQLAVANEQVFAAVGVHPNEALTWREDTLDILHQLTNHPKVVAIGEIGLDYYRDRAPKDLQARIFQAQLDLATEVGLPVVIHCRQAIEDILEYLETWQLNLVAQGSGLVMRPGVLHSYSGGRDAARRATQVNFLIGVTGPVTFPNANELRQTISSLKLEDLLIETDAPFLTPQPYRGKRNEPAYVYYVAEKLAELFNLAVDSVASTTTINAGRIFNW